MSEIIETGDTYKMVEEHLQKMWFTDKYLLFVVTQTFKDSSK
jgi:hypothetical protein